MGRIEDEVNPMQKVLEAEKINKDISKERKEPGAVSKGYGMMRRRFLVSALASLIAVEPMISACAHLSGQYSPKNPIAAMNQECQGKIPPKQDDKRIREEESSVGEARMQEIIKELRKSAVLISSDEALGSGVILYRCGGETAILTNRHVVQGDESKDGKIISAPNIIVNNEGKSVKPIRIVLAPDDLDLALIFVKEDIGPPARLAKDKPNIGARVVIVGSPLGIEDSVSRGIISNFINDKEMPFEAIQTDAAMNPGNSGGGLFLTNGELIGITTFKLVLGLGFAEGMGYAIPVSVLQDDKLADWKEIPITPKTEPKPEAPKKK